MQRIISQQNSLIKRLISLKTDKGRRKHHLYPIEGYRLIGEAIEQNMRVDTLAVQEDCIDKTGDIIKYAQKCDAQVLIVPVRVMERLCDTDHPQGLYAALPLPGDIPMPGPRILALDGISDPGNMGAMLRTAAAFGIVDVLIGGGCTDAFSPKCVRAGMGAHFRLRVHRAEALQDILEKLKIQGYDIIGASVKGTETMCGAKQRIVCVIGSEAQGLSDAVAAQCTRLYRIPMTEGSESLNAAVAAGIVMFQCFIMQMQD